MRYFLNEVLVIFLVLILCSCGREKVKMFDNDKEISDKCMKDIILAIEEKDSDKIFSMFSAKAKNDNNCISEGISVFLDKFNDNNLVFEENPGPVAYEEVESGQKAKKIVNWYDVTGENTNYIFFFVEWIEDTENPGNVGLYTLRIIEEKDYEEQYTYHDKMETAGLYYNPS